jgi:glyoxylase-like metal-dependent hydrolase (beta-lactamase superfamily II)/rhodanese-related sulfurtransferase
MFIKQLLTGCLSEYAYYIESNGVAAVIDPLRDIDDYLQLAKERNAEIKYIFETHFHADFVSGHLDLAAATGATIVFGPSTTTKFKIYVAKDGEEFKLGDVSIKLLHTPGHTLESSCYLLMDEKGTPISIFTGDTLFIGDVGRPDLAQNADITMSELAGILYESINSKILTLYDDIIVYPGHGAGSSCGKNLSKENQSTIGEQKLTNYALQGLSKEDFIKEVTTGLGAPPKYFPINAQINKEGYENLNIILEKGLRKLSVSAFKEKAKDDNTIILDTRPAKVFVEGFVPNSIFIGLEGRFAEWAANLLSFEKTIILVTEPSKEQETITRLARVGFEKIGGYLDGSYEAWQAAGEQIDLLVDVEADELAMDIAFDNNLVVLDVRKEIEYDNGHLKQSVNIPLEELIDPGNLADFDEHHNIYVQCGGGYRSVIACSLLKLHDIHNLRNILGGWDAITRLEDKFDITKNEAVLN